MTRGREETGDGPERRARWDQRYRSGEPVDPGRPARLLEEATPWLPRRGRALDLACGAGRNALFLARRGLRVVAVDFSAEGLRRLQDRARGERLPVQPVRADLTRFALRDGRFDVVVNTHFLERRAFPLIRQALAPGGLLVFETFNVDEIELLGGDIRRAYALDRGELRRAFGDLELLVYEEGIFDREEGQRGLARLVGRKPPGAVSPSGAPGRRPDPPRGGPPDRGSPG